MCLSAPGKADSDYVMPSAAWNEQRTLQRIAIGSCARPENDQTIYDQILSTSPQAFLFIGDNIYAPRKLSDNLSELEVEYQKLAESEPFRRLREKVPMLVTWDDHDFGPNDGGGDWPLKETSQKIFNQAWDVKDERLTREGVYYSRISGKPGQQIQFIMLDTRYFRSPLKRNPRGSAFRYAQIHEPETTMLGESQWQWLEQELKKKADIRLLVSSIQVIADGHGWEAWRTMPAERQRLYDLIRDTKANGVVLVSGDRHSAAIYRQTDQVAYPLWELTASSLNIPLSSFVKNIETEPGPFRQGEPYYDENYGIIDVDWQSGEIFLQIHDQQGRVVRASSLNIKALKVSNRF